MTAERIAVFLLMLSVLVVLHEYGHFLIARLNGVRVTDFAVGFGPTLLKWTSPRSGTNYRINLLPIGGYCQMKGEDGKTSEAEQQREFRSASGSAYETDNFQAKTPLQRLAIVVAGPIANFIVALALFFGGGYGYSNLFSPDQQGYNQPDLIAYTATLGGGLSATIAAQSAGAGSPG